MKKILSIILAFSLVLSFGTTAFAANGETTTGSLTIENAIPGQTYKIYRIFDLYSFKTNTDENDQFVYKVNEEWRSFVSSATYHNDIDNDGAVDEGETVQLFVIDDESYVTLNTDLSFPQSVWADFAQDAKAYAENAENNITCHGSWTAAEGETVKFGTDDETLKLGWYLVTSTTGFVCTLDTTDPNVVVQEKNGVPTIDKQVKEDADNEWKENNSADINQVVEYKTIIEVKHGAFNYVVHDKMDDGLTFDTTSVVVKKGSLAENEEITAENIGKAEAAASTVANTNYTVDTAPECEECDWNSNGYFGDSADNGCTFTVAFDNDFLATLGTGDYLFIYYSATLNANATVDVPEYNYTHMQYGNNSVTVNKNTTTNTYEFDMAKIDGETEAVITGAEFKLYKKITDNSTTPATESYVEFPLVEAADGVYRPAASGEAGAVIKVGEATITGLDKDVYYLKETKQPDGYNKVKEYIEVDLSAGSAKDTYEYVDETAEDGKDYAAVVVKNNRGVELPSTGGMGTTIFYIVGGVMTVGALVVIIARKRIGETE